MKKFIGTFGAIMTAFVEQAAQASIPQPAHDAAARSDDAAEAVQVFRAANTMGEAHNFVLRRTNDHRVIMAGHESHASHASHTSHYSNSY